MQASQKIGPINDGDAPYVSVVVTARNDDHGGNLLSRMQVFVDAWINQAKRHHLPSELILVEWNPPVDRERLVTGLSWPSDTGPCQVRIIEVPPEVHARYHNAAALPLYQMIAKNAGIRRARGEFILATNIDIVFSDELMKFLASRRLEKGRMYRMDRTDVMSNVPVNGTLDEQLAYCRRHMIRLFAREGVFPLTADGRRQNEPEDITRPDSGIHFGDGWSPVERYHPAEPFRWLANDAEVLARVPAGGAVMELELEAGPGIERTPAVVQVVDASGSEVAEFSVEGRTTIALVLAPRDGSAMQSFRLRTQAGGLPVTYDHRILNFRVFRCDWGRPQPRVPHSAVRQAGPTLARLLVALRARYGWGPAVIRGLGTCRRALRLLRMRSDDIFEAVTEVWAGRGWYDLERSGAERFRWVAEEAQLTIRISRETRTLGILLEPGPSVGFQPFTLVARTAGGETIARSHVHGLTYVEFAIPAPARGTIATIFLRAEGGGLPRAADGRVLSFRVFACGTGLQQNSGDAADASAGSWEVASVRSQSAALDWRVAPEQRRQISEMGKPPLLHVNACGDFTLMSREHWFDVRGYPELDQFSMHLDLFLCYTAHYSGVREEVLTEPMRIYHIEHDFASGWTPEGQTRYIGRVIEKGIPLLSYDDVLWFVNHLRTLHAPIIFNLDKWGLAELDLAEIDPCAAVYASRTSL